MKTVISTIASLLVVSDAASVVISHRSNHTDACGRIFERGLNYLPHGREKLPICPFLFFSTPKVVLNCGS